MGPLLPDNFAADLPGGTTGTSGFAQSAVQLSRQLTWLFWANAINACAELVNDATKLIGPSVPYAISGPLHITNALNVLRKGYASDLIMHDERYEVISLGPGACVVLARYRIEDAKGATTTHLQSPSLPFICSFAWSQAPDGDPRLMLWQWAGLAAQLASSKGAAGGERTRATTPPISTRNTAGTSDARHTALQARGNDGITYWIQPGTIIYVAAAHQYTDVYCTDRRLRLRASFASVTEQLSSVVVNVHRSYAVNPAYVSHFEGSLLYLTNGTVVPIPERRTRQIRQMLQEHFERLGQRE